MMDIIDIVSIKSMINNFILNKNECGAVLISAPKNNEGRMVDFVKRTEFSSKEEFKRYFNEIDMIQRFTDTIPDMILNLHNEDSGINSYLSVSSDNILLCDLHGQNNSDDEYRCIDYDMEPEMYINSLRIAKTIYNFICL